jgi:hypothetical protein
MLDNIRDLSKQLRLSMLIIDNFIPPENQVRKWTTHSFHPLAPSQPHRQLAPHVTFILFDAARETVHS